MSATQSLTDLKLCQAAILELPDITDAHHELKVHALLQRIHKVTPDFAVIAPIIVYTSRTIGDRYSRHQEGLCVPGNGHSGP